MSKAAFIFIFLTLCVSCTKSAKNHNEQDQTNQKEDWVCVAAMNEKNWACSKTDENLNVVDAE